MVERDERRASDHDDTRVNYCRRHHCLSHYTIMSFGGSDDLGGGWAAPIIGDPIKDALQREQLLKSVAF